MSISPAGGDLLYILVRAKRPNTVIEFGTSYGISTIHLAAAVADNGTGRVVSTELSMVKVLAARANLEEAGLADRVTILLGDARTTLDDIAGPIDLVLLDGWKELCLPLLQLLESRLAIGALIVADDIKLPSLSSYLNNVRSPANGYVSVAFPIEDGMELSCWTADGRADEKVRYDCRNGRQGGGRIVQVSSEGGQVAPDKKQSAYGAGFYWVRLSRGQPLPQKALNLSWLAIP